MNILVEDTELGWYEGQLLETKRTLEAPDTVGGSATIWLRIMRILGSPTHTRIEAVDATAWLGISRLRRRLHFAIPTQTYPDLVKFTIARSGLPFTMRDGTTQQLGGELNISPNRNLRSILLDLSRLSKYWHVRNDPANGFALECIPIQYPSAADYEYGEGEDLHPIIQPIENRSIVEAGLSIAEGQLVEGCASLRATRP